MCTETIELIIVGCGFAGLACAIESKRKGHKVILLEKHDRLYIPGDVISFAPNAGRIFERWGLGEQLMEICTQHPTMNIHNHLGEFLVAQELPQKVFGSNSFNGRRGEIHDILLKYAKEIGVDVRFGQYVTSYWEDCAKGRAGVVVNGYGIEADLIVGADGIRSQARKSVLGYEDRPKASGYAIYRSWFNAKDQGTDKNPLTEYYCKDGGAFDVWIGEDMHLLVMSFHNGQDICWLLTHKDDHAAEESWSLPGNMADVLKLVEKWDPRCRAIVEQTPSCIDWKLAHRDPLPTWVSDAGRIVLIGDAAHPFLPTSVQGASQGVEDGVILAVVLQLAKKQNVPLAARVFERMRYARVCHAQLMGESNRNKWHKPKADPTSEDVEIPFPEWLLGFNAESHAYAKYSEIAAAILMEGYKRPNELNIMDVQ